MASRGGQVRSVAREVAAFALNVLAFLVAMGLAFRVIYPAVFAILAQQQRHVVSEFAGIVLSNVIGFASIGVVSRAWTRHVLSVVGASACVFLAGMLGLSQAMYLGDGGDPSIMWSYIRPGVAEVVGALLCAGGAATGWYAGGSIQAWRARQARLVERAISWCCRTMG